MQRITPFLWFNGNAEEAMDFYIAVFSAIGGKKSKIINVSRQGEKGPLFTATFEINGQKMMVLNGGPEFKFTEAISFFVDCETQQEVDELWEKLSEGGQKNRCGWLKDKFGLSWQIIPTILGKLLRDKDPEKSQRVMKAMLQMDKIDIKKLQQVYEN